MIKRKRLIILNRKKETSSNFSEILPLEFLANQIKNIELKNESHRDYDKIEPGNSVNELINVQTHDPLMS